MPAAISDLYHASPPDGHALGWELLPAAALKGVELGAPSAVTLSPVAWLLFRSRPYWQEILPKLGCAGVVGGAVLGAGAMVAAAATYPTSSLKGLAVLARHSENERLDQWATLGAGAGAMLGTPGPGSLLFQEATWLPRLGGAAAMGVTFAVGAYWASLHPKAVPVLGHLPLTMQPNPAELQQVREALQQRQ